MTAAVQSLLDSFDALSEAEQHQVIVEVLRRAEHSTSVELPDRALVAAADTLFVELDKQEAADAHPKPRWSRMPSVGGWDSDGR